MKSLLVPFSHLPVMQSQSPSPWLVLSMTQAAVSTIFYCPRPPSPNITSTAAQNWHDILSLSGRSLQERKCSYHFLYFQFTPAGLPVLQGGLNDPIITITNNNKTPQQIKQLSSYTPHKTLGAYKSPCGPSTLRLKHLTTKNVSHTVLLQALPFISAEARLYYTTIYPPSITYPFPSMSLKKTDTNRLQHTFKSSILPKLGFNHHTPNGVVYGSKWYGGLSLRSLTAELVINQVVHLIKCLRTPGITNQLAQITIAWAQLLAGTSTSIFRSAIPLPQLDPMVWIPQIRLFLIKNHLTLELLTCQNHNERSIPVSWIGLWNKRIPNENFRLLMPVASFFKSFLSAISQPSTVNVCTRISSVATTFPGVNLNPSFHIKHGPTSTAGDYGVASFLLWLNPSVIGSINHLGHGSQMHTNHTARGKVTLT